MVRLTVRKDLCIACHLCTQVFPHLFGLDRGGLAVPLRQILREREEGDALVAQEACPVAAIRMETVDNSPIPG